MGVLRRFLTIFHKHEFEQDLDDEIRFHLEMRIQEYIRSGVAPDQARQAALRLFGNDTLLKEKTRAMDTIGWMESAWQDLRYCGHLLVSKPSFSVTALLILSLGIGLNAAIFSVLNSVLLRPLPYREPDRLTQVFESNERLGENKFVVSRANFLDWRKQSQTFEEMTAFNIWLPSLTGSGEPVELTGAIVTPEFFSVFGTAPQLGRGFSPDDLAQGGQRVAILGYGLWQSRFGGDPGIIGRTLILDGKPRSVVGVMPQWFRHPELLLKKEVQIWAPFTIDPANGSRGFRYLRVIGRLKPGVSREQARSEMATVAGQLEQQYPDTNKDWGVRLVALHEQITGAIKPALMILQAAVGLLLLVACSNIAILLLSYGKAREKEIVIRSALGAGRGRLIRQLFTESFVLAAAGGVLGIALGSVAVRAFVSAAPREFPRLSEIRLDMAAIIFTVCVTLVTWLIFGIAPAIQIWKRTLSWSLNLGRQSSAAGRGASRLRGFLIVAEVALTLMLLTGAGLLIKSFVKLGSIKPGFNPDNLLTMEVSLPGQYKEDHQVAGFYDEMLSRLQSLPGVESAGTVLSLPLTGLNDLGIGLTIEGQPPPSPDRKPSCQYRTISPAYFTSMLIPLIAGRFFSDSDASGSPRVVIVNEAMAKRYWPGEDPIGKHVSYGAFGPIVSPTVVGVVGDVKHGGLESDAEVEMYVPYRQNPWNFSALVVRASKNPMALAKAVESTIWSIDQDTLVSEVASMDNVISDSIARPRFNTFLLSVFAAAALMLTAVGMYGVVSYSVSQRTSEIGIKMALGAQATDVLKFTMANALANSLTGIGAGLIGAAALTRMLKSLLFDLSTSDPGVFISIPLLVLTIVLLSSYVPARRATRVDPIKALRVE